MRHQAASSVVLPKLGLLSYALPWRQGQRNVFALLLLVGVCAWFWAPIVKLFALASENEHFSHVLLIPALTSYLLFMNRTTILTSHTWSPLVGLLVMAGGAVCYWLADGRDWTQDRLAVAILAFVVMCWGLFLFSFGAGCFRKDLFALVMLFFMVPLPAVFLDEVIGFLQRGSAEVTAFLFSVLGVPVFREGFVFSLSHFTIYVAEECSGIRSFLSLIITALVADYWFLKTWWARVALVAVVVPLAIVKNAFRIVGLALLANYVDPTYITDSALHRSGGIPLFLLSLVVLVGVVWLLRRYERRPASTIVQ
ncbi:MAG: exosortase/archaeosortase family protein [Nitrospira sp.]|nr:exosortase/archaeosortase family protein [Nitrospira sp.]